MIKINADITYEYNDINNTVTAYVHNEGGFTNTKPTWILSEDKKTYSKLFTSNQVYSTPFVDMAGNTSMIEINISLIDDLPPNITLEYILNEDNSVTAKVISSEELKHTKISWILSEDKKTYTNTFITNQDYITNFMDIYGNITSVNINFNLIK